MLITRIITAAFYGVAITAAVLFLPTAGVAAVFGALWLAGAWEWAGFARFRTRGHAVYAVLFGAAMGVLWEFSGRPLTVGMLAVALVFWLVAVGAVLKFPRPFAASVVVVSGFVVLLPSWWLLVRLHGAMRIFRLLSLHYWLSCWDVPAAV